MRAAAEVARQEEMWDAARVAHYMDEQARLAEEQARAQAQANGRAQFDERYRFRYRLSTEPTAREDVFRTLDQGRSNTAPGSLPGQAAPNDIPPGHPIPGAVYGPAPPGQRLSWEHVNRQAGPPQMMQGPTSRMGMPTEPQRYDPTRGPSTYERCSILGYGGDRPSSSSIHSQHTTPDRNVPHGTGLPTTNDLTRHAQENEALYNQLPYAEAINKAFQSGRRASAEYFTRSNHGSSDAGGRSFHNRISNPGYQEDVGVPNGKQFTRPPATGVKFTGSVRGEQGLAEWESFATAVKIRMSSTTVVNRNTGLYEWMLSLIHI